MEATSETLVCGTLRGESLLPDWAFRQLEGELLLMEAESQDLLGFQLWDCMVSSSCWQELVSSGPAGRWCCWRRRSSRGRKTWLLIDSPQWLFINRSSPETLEWDKTLDHQRTNTREYQIERTQTKETDFVHKTWHHPTTSSTLCKTCHLSSKNKNTNPVISRQDYHLTQPYPSEKKQTNKNSTQAYKKDWINLRRAETKRKKEFNLEAWERRPQTQ